MKTGIVKMIYPLLRVDFSMINQLKQK